MNEWNHGDGRHCYGSNDGHNDDDTIQLNE